GVVDDVTEVRWDIRPVPRFGTIEQRACDGVATLRQVGAITALTRCLVHEVVGSDLDQQVEILPPWYVQENKWRAARYGLDATIIVESEGTDLHVKEDLERVLNRLKPIADELGCSRELSWVSEMLKEGTLAAQQREKMGSHFGAKVDRDKLTALVLDSASETAASIRNW